MGQVTSQLMVKLVDGVSGPAKVAAASLTKLTSAASGRGIASGLSTQLRSMRREIDALGHSFGLLSGITAAGFMYSQYEWDSLLHRYKAITEISDGGLKGVVEQIRNIANETGKMPVELLEAAQGWAELGNAPESFIKNVKVAARTSRITGISVAEQMKESSALLRAFGFKTSDEAAFKHFEEVYLVASKGMKGGAHAFGEAMKAWAPIASGLQLTVEEASALVQTLGGQFEASEIGNALKTGFLRLASPTPKAEAAMRGAGIDRSKLFRYDNQKVKDSGALIRALRGSGSFSVSTAAQQTISRELAKADVSKGADKLADHLNKTLVKSLGLKKHDAMGRKVLQQLILSHMAGAAEGLDTGEFFKKFGPLANNLAFISAVFGKEHAAKFMDLLKQSEHYAENLEKIKEHAPGAVEKKWGIFNDGFAASWDRLRAAVKAFVDTSEGATAIGRDMADMMDRIAGVFKLLQEADPAWVKFGFRLAMVAALIYPARMAISALAASMRLLGAATRAAWLMGLAPWAMGARGVTAAVGGIRAALGRLGAAMILFGPMGGLRASLAALGAAFLRLLNPLRAVRGAAVAARFALRGVMAVTGFGAIALAATFVYENFSKLKAAIQGFASAAPRSLGAVGRAIKWIVDKLSSISLELQGTDEEWRAAGQKLGENLGTAIVAAVKAALASLPGLVKAAAVGLANSAIGIGGKMKPGDTGDAAGGESGAVPDFGGARAAGGPVRRGRVYLVGERGPELFRPGASGRIIPNGATGAGGDIHNHVTIHVASVADPAEIADRVQAELGRRVRAELRSLHADVTMRA